MWPPSERTLEASQGQVTVKPDVAGGVSADVISENGTNNVFINGTVAQINTTLADPDAVTYQSNTSDIVPEFVTIPEGINITKQQAVNRIKSWLQVKSYVFGRFYNRQRLREYTTGKYFEESLERLNWLKKNNNYYTYRSSTAEAAVFCERESGNNRCKS
ncbi:MAG: DUF4101 domain-containing protein [Hormoscilla sp. SP5CHS1]|nr:DUF4101 domain-containing protein [Hormoscilla sp. SP5CHS1]